MPDFRKSPYNLRYTRRLLYADSSGEAQTKAEGKPMLLLIYARRVMHQVWSTVLAGVQGEADR